MAFTIAFPALAGVLRFRRLHVNDRFLVFIIWLGLTNELVSLAFILLQGSNATSYNFYILIESVCFMILFSKWGLIRNRMLFAFLIIAIVALWLFDNVIASNIKTFYGSFNVCFALLVTFFSLNCIAKRIAYYTGNIFTDGRFLAGVGLLSYHGIKAITDSFFIVDMHLSQQLARDILYISSTVNIISNFLFTAAILCFNRNQKFTLEYW